MPDKWYRSGCGSSCIRCWENRLRHANPVTQKHGKLDLPEEEEEEKGEKQHPRIYKGSHGYIQWKRIGWNTVFIMDIVIRPKHQRKGFGSKMLRQFIQEQQKNGCRKIELDNCTDHEFFEKNGFRFRQEGDNAMIVHLK